MKVKTRKILLLVMTAIMLVSVVAHGYFDAVIKSKSIVEKYEREFTLKETVKFVDPEIIKEYGGTVILEAGTKGRINDSFEQYNESHGYKHIYAYLILNNEPYISVLLMSKEDADANGYYYKRYLDTTSKISNGQDINVIPGGFWEVRPIVVYDQIEDSETIVAEFEKVQEKYNQEIRQTVISGTFEKALAPVIVVLAFGVICLIVRNEKALKVLFVISICVDVVLIFSAWLEWYFSTTL